MGECSMAKRGGIVMAEDVEHGRWCKEEEEARGVVTAECVENHAQQGSGDWEVV